MTRAILAILVAATLAISGCAASAEEEACKNPTSETCEAFHRQEVKKYDEFKNAEARIHEEEKLHEAAREAERLEREGR